MDTIVEGAIHDTTYLCVQQVDDEENSWVFAWRWLSRSALILKYKKAKGELAFILTCSCLDPTLQTLTDDRRLLLTLG